MNDLKRNAEGYADPTACGAINNVDNSLKYKRGDIYRIESASGSVGNEMRAGRPGVIVSNDTGNRHSNIVEVVFLTAREKTPLPTHTNVKAFQMSTALCEQITTVSKMRIGDFIRVCTDAEMKAIDECLRVSLGIESEENKNDDEHIEKIKKLEEDLKKYKHENADLREKAFFTQNVNDDIIKLSTERDLYKSLYDGLINRMVGDAS